MAGFGPLIQADRVERELSAPDLRVVDVRWYLDGRSGWQAYLSGHIPGAVFCDLDRDLSAPTGAGRHPLPERSNFESAMRRLGVGSRTRVVAYDDAGGSVAARLWWLLGAYGHPSVAVLDGGIQAWEGPLERTPATPPPGDFRAQELDRSRVVDYDAVRGRAPETVLMDARAGSRFRGEVEPVDPKAGHIPGAINAYWQENLRGDGRFKRSQELRSLYEGLGVGT